MMLLDLMRFAARKGASDLHLSSNLQPLLRVQGDLKPVQGETLTEETLSAFIRSLLDHKLQARFEQGQDIDFSFSVEDAGRIRANVYRHRDGLAAAFRLLPAEIKSMEQLGLPESLREFCRHRKGLILITGPTGSGKSTTLAAMMQEICKTRREHVITLEDPIEYCFPQSRALIHQREIGEHSGDFASALRSALREDPDVLLVGEMRDLETVSQTLKAAETGHLVMSTLHTNSAAETVNRIIDMFPGEYQPQIRLMLANTLLAVVAQRLVPSRRIEARVPVCEILVGTGAVRNLIRESKTHQLETVIQTGSEFGMQTFAQSFERQVERGLLSAAQRLEEHL